MILYFNLLQHNQFIGFVSSSFSNFLTIQPSELFINYKWRLHIIIGYGTLINSFSHETIT